MKIAVLLPIIFHFYSVSSSDMYEIPVESEESFLENSDLVISEINTLSNFSIFSGLMGKITKMMESPASRLASSLSDPTIIKKCKAGYFNDIKRVSEMIITDSDTSEIHSLCEMFDPFLNLTDFYYGINHSEIKIDEIKEWCFCSYTNNLKTLLNTHRLWDIQKIKRLELMSSLLQTFELLLKTYKNSGILNFIDNKIFNSNVLAKSLVILLKTDLEFSKCTAVLKNEQFFITLERTIRTVYIYFIHRCIEQMKISGVETKCNNFTPSEKRRFF